MVAALDLIYNDQQKNFVIYTDSKSIIEALSKFNDFHPLVQKAQEWLFRISCRYKSVHFCWVPSHVGIHGNEVADEKARNFMENADFEVDKVPHSDMKRSIKLYILQKWQERWASPLLLNNKKYKSIRSTIEPWHSSFNPNRRVEVILSRMRIGHTRLTHNFILEGSSAPMCAHCDDSLSIEHILVHCSRVKNARDKYRMGNKSLAEILNDSVNIEALIGFLKEVKIYNEI